MSPEAGERSARVLIVDDHQMFADSLVRLLEDEPDFRVVGIAGTIAAAIQTVRSTRPDVVLLDYRLPDGEAPELIVQLRKITPGIRVLIMTGLDDDTTMRTVRDVGCPVVTKDRAAADLLAALRSVVTADSSGPDSTRPSAPPLRSAPGPAQLVSDRERELLVQLAQGASTREIADALHISPTTVRNHVQRVLAKLGVHSRLEAVAMAIQTGIVAPPRRQL